jgi:hypothetical protein
LKAPHFFEQGRELPRETLVEISKVQGQSDGGVGVKYGGVVPNRQQIFRQSTLREIVDQWGQVEYKGTQQKILLLI